MYIVKEWLKAIGCMLGLLSSMLVQFVFFHGVDEHFAGRHKFFLSFNEVVVFAMRSSTRMLDSMRGGETMGCVYFSTLSFIIVIW